MLRNLVFCLAMNEMPVTDSIQAHIAIQFEKVNKLGRWAVKMTPLCFSPGCWVLILQWGKSPLSWGMLVNMVANVSSCFAPLFRLLKQLELFIVWLTDRTKNYRFQFIKGHLIAVNQSKFVYSSCEVAEKHCKLICREVLLLKENKWSGCWVKLAWLETFWVFNCNFKNSGLLSRSKL